MSQYYISRWHAIAMRVNFNAQSSSTLIGGRAGGLAYSSSCLDDEWSIFNNIGGLAKLKTQQFPLLAMHSRRSSHLIGWQQ